MSTKFSRLFVKPNRFGLHYFQDTLHYRESDLNQWLPELTSLNISYLILKSPANRAIPEYFIEGLVKAGIEPILHFDIPLTETVDINQLDPVLNAYAKWNIHTAIFYDKPNMRSSWDSSKWVQSELINSFLEKYLPLANLGLKYGIFPAFSPLEPGGHYWDTVFLRSSLEMMIQKEQTNILDNLILTAYAWNWNHSLNWGMGGAAHWQNSKPYSTPVDSQDQKGFRTYEWYQEIAQSVLSQPHPVILLGAGLVQNPLQTVDSSELFTDQVERSITIARLLNREQLCDSTNPQNSLNPISEEVFNCNFWLLSADSGSSFINQAWYKSFDRPNPIVTAWKDMGNYSVEESNAGNRPAKNSATESISSSEKALNTVEEVTNQTLTNEKNSVFTDLNAYLDHSEHQETQTPVHTQAEMPLDADKNKQNSNNLHVDKIGRKPKSPSPLSRPIKHYLLLPSYEWGVTDWHLEVIKPFVKKYRPTIGFSIKEAVLAERITIIGGPQIFPEDLVERFRLSGCEVDRIEGNGTTIATILGER